MKRTWSSLKIGCFNQYYLKALTIILIVLLGVDGKLKLTRDKINLVTFTQNKFLAC